jgi:hypothetical protein
MSTNYAERWYRKPIADANPTNNGEQSGFKSWAKQKVEKGIGLPPVRTSYSPGQIKRKRVYNSK